MPTRNYILDAVFFPFVERFSRLKVVLVNLLINETGWWGRGFGFVQILFHVATAMDAINLKDIKGNACIL